MFNDLWLEGGRRQWAQQSALLRDNLHPTAIFLTKHQLTRLILHHKLGFPHPLGRVCERRNLKSRSGAGRKSTVKKQECHAAPRGDARVIVFNIPPQTFASQMYKYLEKAKSCRGVHQINYCNHYEFVLFSPPSLFFWLPAVLIHSQVNTTQQSVSIKPYCSSQFSICHRVHLQWKQYDFREQYDAICFGLFQRNSENDPAAVDR